MLLEHFLTFFELLLKLSDFLFVFKFIFAMLFISLLGVLLLQGQLAFECINLNLRVLLSHKELIPDFHNGNSLLLLFLSDRIELTLKFIDFTF